MIAKLKLFMFGEKGIDGWHLAIFFILGLYIGHI